jgi:protein-disulfide isomerase-like protein with CxxC motif
MSEPKVFSEWLKSKLEKPYQTGADFAISAKISRASAYHYLEGRRVPNTVAALEKIAAALGMTTGDVAAEVSNLTKSLRP